MKPADFNRLDCLTVPKHGQTAIRFSNRLPGTAHRLTTRQIHRAVGRYGPESILVTSFSRAAAAELAGRDLPIASDRVGTLHSHCWHALGGPEIAEANVEEWNKENPHLAITPQRRHGKLDGEEAASNSAVCRRQSIVAVNCFADEKTTYSTAKNVGRPPDTHHGLLRQALPPTESRPALGKD